MSPVMTPSNKIRPMQLPSRRLLLPLLAALMFAGPALAQPAAAPVPSDNTVVNLIRLMVKRGLLSAAEADALVRQAEAEAAQARAAADTAKAPASTPAPPADLPAGAVFVPYVPETVRQQLREEIKADVMQKAQAEKWAAPGATPTWTQRITLSGDMRLRNEHQQFDNGNAFGLIDYATFNADGPFDINPATNPEAFFPYLNSLEDRDAYLRLRARLNVAATVSDYVSANLRIATGGSRSPVSTNETLGGGLGKKDLWLDRAYVSIKPSEGYRVSLGRMPNPFFSTDLIYDEDLNFDGIAFGHDRPLWEDSGRSLGVFGRIGAFPIEYGGASFPGKSVVKQKDQTKWLFGAQLGTDWAMSETSKLKFGVGYYDYTNIQGRLSEPCVVFNGNEDCSSDPTVPPFMQKGNTLFLVRNVVADPSNPGGSEEPQFAGLTYDYELLSLTAQYDLDLPGTWRHLSAQAEYVVNLAYDDGEAFRDPATPLDDPITNFAASSDPSAPLGPYESGDTGWMVKLTLGEAMPSYPWAWNLMLGYKYLEPDAVLDAYTDSDFHLGGTNAEGYMLGAGVGLYRNTWLSARWLSANEVSGPPLGIDVLQIDLNLRF